MYEVIIVYRVNNSEDANMLANEACVGGAEAVTIIGSDADPDNE